MHFDRGSPFMAQHSTDTPAAAACSAMACKCSFRSRKPSSIGTIFLTLRRLRTFLYNCTQLMEIAGTSLRPAASSTVAK